METTVQSGDTGTAFERREPASISSLEQGPPDAQNIFWQSGKVSQQCRIRQSGHRPATVWLTGLSGAGKSTIAYELEMLLLAEGHPSYVLDGDNLRHHLNRDLGFSPQDRKENIRRAAEVARMMNDAGLLVVTSFISPYREDRAMAAAIIGADRFIEVHVCTPVDVCEARDPKGLYAKARAGKLPEFTGISSPYEPPLTPAIALDTVALSVDEAARALYRCLVRRFV